MYKELSERLKIMADASRLEIIDLLSCGELCAYDILEHFSFSQPTLSHHMKILVNSRIVSYRKEGTKTMYSLNQPELKNILQALGKIAGDDADCICHTIKEDHCP